MRKTTIRVAIDYIKINEAYNNRICYLLTGGWVSLDLLSCTSCGELFVTNSESNISVNELSKDLSCPGCNSRLSDTLALYPQTYRMGDGTLEHLSTTLISNELENEVIEIWEI